MKRLFSLLLSVCLLLPLLPRGAAAVSVYPDVPDGSWAGAVLAEARETGLLRGNADGTFGYGRSMTRGEFVTVLCRMFGWTEEQPAVPSFTDLGSWYDGAVEAAAAHGAVDAGGSFRPRDAITRREMAVMLVRALGLFALTQSVDTAALPFTDVTDDRGAIMLAYDIGMVNGKTPTSFDPEGTAKREEAAAMLVRTNARYATRTEWLHGFYAFSSYAQKELAAEMDAVSYGWSSMTWDGATAALDTSGGDWTIPAGYDSITEYLAAAQVRTSLSVYMYAGLAAMLASEEGRAQAVSAIVREATRDYDAIGRSPYTGVTIDFEGLRAASRTQFVDFLTALRAALPAGYTLFCAVQPLTPDPLDCYDGYDYRGIGDVCDRVILMAHDYAPNSMTSLVGTSWQYNAAPAPLPQVWYALRQITDPETGVRDRQKLALALSFGCEGWYVDAQDRLTDGIKRTPSAATAALRRAQSTTVFGFQERTGCSWMNYATESGQRVFLWYESTQAIALRLLAARMFGVTGVSVWRLGIVPTGDGWDVRQALTGAR